MPTGFVFNPPPGWPTPPEGWEPPDGWAPDPAWAPAPPGWVFWLPAPAPPTPPPARARPLEVLSPAPPPLAPVTAAPPTASSPAPGSPDLGGEVASGPLEATANQNTAAPSATRSTPEAEVERLRAALAAAQSEIDALRGSIHEGDSIIELDDERVLQEVGIYRYHHPLENAAAFKVRLGELQERIKEAVKAGNAIEASDMFTFNNSLAKGRKMTADLGKLMLRAYNAEADNCVRSLRAGNVGTAKKRLEASVNSIARLGLIMEMRISSAYHALRIEELELTADWAMKVQEEREAARAERERLREEHKVEAELAAERERLDKERAHLANALAATQSSGDVEAAAELGAKLAALDEAIAQNDYRAANIRAGYVYVISNRGAFGGHVVKIGLTRRLEPYDRVRELGDASVPFPFDVHALFFSEDAVSLEDELHKHFADRRVNVVNERREFFFATPEEVRVVLARKVGNLLEFTDEPESVQYLQSVKYWPPEVGGRLPEE